MTEYTRNEIQARERLFALYGIHKTWDKVAEIMDLPKGSVWAFAYGTWNPRDNDIRVKFGLNPLIEVEGDICPACKRTFVKDHATRVKCKECSPPRVRRYKRRNKYREAWVVMFSACVCNPKLPNFHFTHCPVYHALDYAPDDVIAEYKESTE